MIFFIRSLIISLAITGIVSTVAVAQSDPATLLKDAKLRESIAEPLRLVLDPTLNTVDRREAAGRLLDQSNRDSARAIAAVLGGESPEHAWRAMVEAIALHPDEPRNQWWPTLLARYTEATTESNRAVLADAIGRFDDSKLRRTLRKTSEDEDEQTDVRCQRIRLWGYFRDKDTAKRLLKLTSTDQPEPVQAAAFDALIHLTGLVQLNHDHAAWLLWWNEAGKLGDKDWYQHLLANAARHASAQRLRMNEGERRLLESQSALYRTTRDADRSAVLAYMLRDPLPPIRRLGLDLALQRLLANEPFDEALRVALRERLVDEVSPLRGRSALLLRDLLDEPAAKIVAERLANDEEHVAAVVRSDLLLIARLPQTPVIEPALVLLEDPLLRPEAAGALAAAYDAKLLNKKQQERAAKLARRGLPKQGLPAALVVTLLGKIGNDADFNRIARWVDSDSKPVKQAAALAWAESDRSLKLLADRAHDPVIHPIVIAAAERRGDDPQTLRTLSRYRPQQEQAIEAWSRALVAMAGRVDGESVLWSCQYLEDRGESLATLERLLTAALQTSEEVPSTASQRVPLLLMRSEVRWRAQTPASVLADYDQLKTHLETMDASQVERYQRGRIRVLIEVEDFDEAFAEARRLLGPSAGSSGDPVIDSFIEVARQQVREEKSQVARAVLDQLMLLLGPSIKPEVAQRISLLEAEIREPKPQEP